MHGWGMKNNQAMTKIECSKDAPWGIHESLLDLECPRCGWSVEAPEARAPAPAAEPPLLTLVLGGWPLPAAAA